MADPYFRPYAHEHTLRIAEGTKMGHLRDDTEAAFDRVGLAVGSKVLVTVVDGATYLVAGTESQLHVTRTATGGCAITLPAAGTFEGYQLGIKDAGGGATTYNITITPNGSEKIDGADDYTIDQNYGSLTLYCDGHNWFVK